MKRLVFSAVMALTFMSAYAQADGYLVWTKNAEKSAVSSTDAAEDSASAQKMKSRDFIKEYFPYHSVCNWEKGMRFMVVPEKYDLIVNTFHNSSDKEVSSMTLRHNILVYQGHKEGPDGHPRMYFTTEDNANTYYYEIPSGSFDDYCYGKLGVPTLAYLDEVDIARDKLVGKTLFTKATVYRIDMNNQSGAYEEVKVKRNREVTVMRVGVGSRSFPVKIIVADKDGNEFYQNVAISRTNSGMRDEEFIDGDNARYTFTGSFEMADAILPVSEDFSVYIGETVHTKVRTTMTTRGDGKDRTLTVPTQLTFKIEAAQSHADNDSVTLTLEQTDTRRIYYKNVLFQNPSELVDNPGEKYSGYFGYVFGMDEGMEIETSQAARAAIREGRVIVGMTEEEVTLAVANPDNTKVNNDGTYIWLYNRSQGKRLSVKFGPTHKVITVEVIQPKSKARPVRQKAVTANEEE